MEQNGWIHTNYNNIFFLLQTKLEEAKKRALNFELELGKYKMENKKLLRPLQDAEQKVADLERQHEMQRKEKQSFVVSDCLGVRNTYILE